MIGKQNDVTECMDNVMFQIECALAPSSTELEAEISLVKRFVSTFFDSECCR